jgi:hypothetical protein
MGLLFTIPAGPRQRSHSQVWVPRDSLPHFTVLDSRLPQTEGPGPRIYIPQEQGGPVIPPWTGFPFRRLLRLAGPRWRYSNLPPHGIWLGRSVFLITPLHGPSIKHRFQQYLYCLPRDSVYRSVTYNGRCLFAYLAVIAHRLYTRDICIIYVRELQSKSKWSALSVFIFDIDIDFLDDYSFIQSNKLLVISYTCIVIVREFSLSQVHLPLLPLLWL